MRGVGPIGALRRSLAVRVAVAVVLTQVIVVNLGLVVLFLVRAWHDPAAIEQTRVQAAIKGALRAEADGRIVLAETPALVALRRANPSVRVAALDAATGRLADGSDPGSARLLRVLREEHLLLINFVADVVDVGGRRVFIEFYADDWGWAALPQAVLAALREYAITFGAIGVVVAAATTAVILRGFAPLRRAAEAVSGAGAALPQALATVEGPMEIASFVSAVERSVALVQEKTAREQRFLADAAHELRTPLAVLRARIDRLADRPARDALRDDVDGMARVVAQLLSLSRLRASAPAADSYAARPRLARLVGDLAPLALAGGRALSLEGAEDIRLVGSAAAFDSAVRNVVENAIRAAPAGSEVVVRLGPGPEVRVIDHGPGIPPADRSDVFRPFHRLPGTPGDGAGLGLTIAQDAAALHGGGIRIDETPGGGTTVTIRFAAEVQ